MKTPTTAYGPFLVRDNSIIVKKDGEHINIPLVDIQYLKADGNYTKIYVKNAKHHVAVRIGILMENLPSLVFIRVHRCYVINIDHFTSYKTKHVFLGEHQIPLSKSYKADFLKALMK